MGFDPNVKIASDAGKVEMEQVAYAKGNVQVTSRQTTEAERAEQAGHQAKEASGRKKKSAKCNKDFKQICKDKVAKLLKKKPKQKGGFVKKEKVNRKLERFSQAHQLLTGEEKKDAIKEKLEKLVGDEGIKDSDSPEQILKKVKALTSNVTPEGRARILQNTMLSFLAEVTEGDLLLKVQGPLYEGEGTEQRGVPCALDLFDIEVEDLAKKASKEGAPEGTEGFAEIDIAKARAELNRSLAILKEGGDAAELKKIWDTIRNYDGPTLDLVPALIQSVPRSQLKKVIKVLLSEAGTDLKALGNDAGAELRQIRRIVQQLQALIQFEIAFTKAYSRAKGMVRRDQQAMASKVS